MPSSSKASKMNQRELKSRLVYLEREKHAFEMENENLKRQKDDTENENKRLRRILSRFLSRKQRSLSPPQSDSDATGPVPIGDLPVEIHDMAVTETLRERKTIDWTFLAKYIDQPDRVVLHLPYEKRVHLFSQWLQVNTFNMSDLLDKFEELDAYEKGNNVPYKWRSEIRAAVLHLNPLPDPYESRIDFLFGGYRNRKNTGFLAQVNALPEFHALEALNLGLNFQWRDLNYDKMMKGLYVALPHALAELKKLKVVRILPTANSHQLLVRGKHATRDEAIQGLVKWAEKECQSLKVSLEECLAELERDTKVVIEFESWTSLRK